MTESHTAAFNKPSLLRLLALLLAVLDRTLPRLIQLAVILTVSAMTIYSGVSPHLPERQQGPCLLALVLLPHAFFVVAASRIIAHAMDDGPEASALPLGQWLVATLVVAAAALAVALPLTALLPFPLSLGVIVAQAAVLAWLPLVPALALNGDLASAIRALLGASWRFLATAVPLSLPYLALSSLLGLLAWTFRGDNLSIMEGGIVTLPLLTLYMFSAAVTAALVPTIVLATGCREGRN